MIGVADALYSLNVLSSQENTTPLFHAQQGRFLKIIARACIIV
jgi:hypothetical protein